MITIIMREGHQTTNTNKIKILANFQNFKKDLEIQIFTK
jgi:hypothetical protein